MTESKLISWESKASQALAEEAVSGREDEEAHVTLQSTLAEFEKVMGRPARAAATLIPPEALKVPKVVEARSQATIQRAGLAILSASGKGEEGAMLKALSAAGISRELLPQMLESPDWITVLHTIFRQYVYALNLIEIDSAIVMKAKTGDVNAAKYLRESYAGSDLDKLDEQTRALAQADPETRTRHTKAMIEELQGLVDEAEGAGAKPEAVEAARRKAIEASQERKVARR